MSADRPRDGGPDVDEPDVDLEALLDLQTPWCLRVVATLHIADYIAVGVTQIDELAAAAGCDARALRVVLTHLVGKGVFREDPPGRFGLNRAAEGLLDPAQFLDLDGIGGRMAHAWSTLATFVQTGRPGYEGLFGLPFWEDLEAHPRLAASFDALMGPAGHGVPEHDLELTGGWESVRSVVDVGGGTGAALADILRRHPDVRGTLVDLPGTVARSAATFRSAGVSARVTPAPQSFFDPLPAGADVYLLRKILENWPDRETVAILSRCAEAVAPGGCVLVIGGVVPDGVSPTLSIEMVLLGGTASTLGEFAVLAGTAGLVVVSAGDQPSGHFAVECRLA